jgi:hypothetical protein
LNVSHDFVVSTFHVQAGGIQGGKRGGGSWECNSGLDVTVDRQGWGWSNQRAEPYPAMAQGPTLIAKSTGTLKVNKPSPQQQNPDQCPRSNLCGNVNLTNSSISLASSTTPADNTAYHVDANPQPHL